MILTLAISIDLDLEKSKCMTSYLNSYTKTLEKEVLHYNLYSK